MIENNLCYEGIIMEEKFLDLLNKVNREGMEDLISFIKKTDFFKAPASTRFHGSKEGGLVEHSLKVYEILKYKVENCIEKMEVPEETIILVALLHDICKANFYKVDYRHGEKSVMMITEYIKLTPEEKYAIRWHMGFTEPKELYTTIGIAYTKYPLALLMNEADLEATYFYDT